MRGSFMDSRRAKYSYGDIVSDQVYNLTLGGVVVYGLVANILICMFCTPFALSLNPIALFAGYLVCVIAGSVISAKSDSALLSFLGYNLIVLPVGLVVSISVYHYGGLSSALVYSAFQYTLGITATMFLLASFFPGFFARLHGVLLGGLIGLIISEIILFFLGIRPVVASLIGAGLFSLYIGYDFVRAQQYPKTLDSAVDAAVGIYLDIINLFLRLLRILSRSRSRD